MGLLPDERRDELLGTIQHYACISQVFHRKAKDTVNDRQVVTGVGKADFLLLSVFLYRSFVFFLAFS